MVLQILESVTFPQLAHLLAVQFCQKWTKHSTICLLLKISILFFRKRRLWSMGADRRRWRSGSHDPGARSEPAPDSQDSETFQKTRSPSSRSGNSNSRERRRRKKRLRSRSRGYEQRSRWAMLTKVFVNSKLSFYEITWLWFSNCAQFLSLKHLIRTILVFQLTRIKDMLGRRRGGEPRLFWSSRLGNVCGNARAMPKYLVGGLSNQVLTCHCHPLEKVASSSSWSLSLSSTWSSWNIIPALVFIVTMLWHT